MAKALTLSGSTRKSSHNTALANAIGDKLACNGHTVEKLDLNDFPLSLFNEDMETSLGEPETAIALAEKFSRADIIFIASPEYNGSLSPLLKNTLDWVSRQKIGPYSRAVFGIGAASPGKMGGIGGLGHLRDILNKLGALVVPLSLGVGNSNEAFDTAGRLVDEHSNERADSLVDQLMSISRNR